VATTAIQIARRHRAHVTAADISPLMLKRAEANARAAGVADLVTVTSADITALPFENAAFDVVIAERSPCSPTGPRRPPSWPG
jgi:23S rRNA G2445 N2-methylase RlmL